MGPETLFLGTARGGSVNLATYPRLVYAPQQWGEGVRCHSNGTPVEDIARAARDAGITEQLRRLADQYGVSIAEAAEAIHYTPA